jgi:uncharacterized C2H2 Zn-finger protein
MSNIAHGTYYSIREKGGEMMPELKCPTCGMTFETKEEMQKHGKEHHGM